MDAVLVPDVPDPQAELADRVLEVLDSFGSIEPFLGFIVPTLGLTAALGRGRLRRCGNRALTRWAAPCVRRNVASFGRRGGFPRS